VSIVTESNGFQKKRHGKILFWAELVWAMLSFEIQADALRLSETKFDQECSDRIAKK
jgi:hypothetical protein